MHQLKEITVKNYRSIKLETFALSDYTALIGYNNAGKTNILSACNWLLVNSSLSENDFNNQNDPVEVEGVITGITEEILNNIEVTHRKSISPYIKDESLVIKRVQQKPKDSATSIKLHIKKIDGQWIPNPTGISNAIKAIFPEPILIGAIENIEEDVSKSKAGTTIGKLISEIMTPLEVKYGAKTREALEFLKHKLDADGDDRADELISFDEQANEKLQVLFPDVSIKLHIPTPELKEVFKSGTIKVYENGQVGGKDISSFGSGAQRSIYMALIRQLAEVKKGTSNNSSRILLLIDEPELYLHPQAIEQVRVALKQLSTEGYQIIFATHSAQMVKSKDVNTALLVRKDNVKGTYRRVRIDEAIKKILGTDYQSQREMLFTLSHSHQILFSESVLLTEGDTEHSILPKIIEVLTGGETLGTLKCALVKQGGVKNTQKSMEILNAMDIPTKAIVDLDYAFSSQVIKSGILLDGDQDILACKNIFEEMKISGDVVLENGLPTKKGNLKPNDAYLKMSKYVPQNINNLHSKFIEHKIWLWKKGVIETHLGLSAKSPEHWSTFVERLDKEDYKEIIPDYKEIEKLVNWIRG